MKIQIAILIAIVFTAGCGHIGMPPPTDDPVSGSDIHGTWEYRARHRGDFAQITFHTNNTFTHTMNFNSSSTIITNKGKWSLDGPYIDLKPFWTTGNSKHRTLNKHSSGRWWVSGWYTPGLAPFGGDSTDPDQWFGMGRVK
jgi:hypothetical protein